MNPSGRSHTLRVVLFRQVGCVILPSLILAACSASSQSARYKDQADQFRAEGRLAQAVLSYRQALKSRPDDPELLRLLGMALASQGRGRSAALSLNRAAALKPDTSIKTALAQLTVRPQDGLSLSLAWLANGLDAEPVGAAVASNRIFVVYAGGRMMALDESSGQVLWDIEGQSAFVSPPGADADQVWVGAEDGSVFAYDAGSGRMLGSYHTKGAVYAAPALTSDMAFCPSNDGSLYALDRSSLKLVWKAALGDALHVSPLVNDRAVYIGSIDGSVHGLDAATGRPIWTRGFLTQGAVESVPASADGRIFVGSADGRVYALDAATGAEYWRYSTPDAIYAHPLVLNEQLIIASSGQLLASLRQLDGVPSWSLFFEHPVVQAPVFFKERLYLVTRSDPRLFAVDHQTGTLLGELNTGDWIAYGPRVAGTDLILVGQDGAVFLYR